jgi:hypothetical protein
MKIQFICWFTIIKKQAFPQKPAFLKNPDLPGNNLQKIMFF